MQGYKNTMEDTFITDITSLQDNIYLFSVFDGHGGSEVAQYLKRNFVPYLKQNRHFKKKEYALSLTEVFQQMDKSLIAENVDRKLKRLGKKLSTDSNYDSRGVAYGMGATACVILITPDKIIVANCGDCRWIISENKYPYQLSYDHKPDLSYEYDRVTSAGGYVSPRKKKVNGRLSVSRCFGDFKFKWDPYLPFPKQMVVATPEIWTYQRNKNIDYLFVAWDGIWECSDIFKINKFISNEFTQLRTQRTIKRKLSKIVSKLFKKHTPKDVLSSGRLTMNTHIMHYFLIWFLAYFSLYLYQKHISVT